MRLLRGEEDKELAAQAAIAKAEAAAEELREAIEAGVEEEAARKGPCFEEVKLEELKRKQVELRKRVESLRAKRLKELMAALESVGAQVPSDTPWRLTLLLSSGEWFFYNETSGEKTWEAPAGAPTVARSDPGGGDERWQMVLDLGTGAWYYYDAEVSATSWEPPVGVPSMAACPEEPPAPWRRVLHVAAKEWCYHNEETGETSWDPPGSGSPEPTAPPGPCYPALLP